MRSRMNPLHRLPIVQACIGGTHISSGAGVGEDSVDRKISVNPRSHDDTEA